MKTSHSLLLLLACALLSVFPARAETKVKPDNDKPALHVTVVEPLGGVGSAFTDFDRFDLALQSVAKQRQWPVKIVAERLSGGSSEHDPELRIALQRVRLDPGNEYVFRAWTTLVLQGEKHDFAIVTANYSARFNENQEDLFQNVVRKGANAIADKIEPLLFPELGVKDKARK